MTVAGAALGFLEVSFRKGWETTTFVFFYLIGFGFCSWLIFE
jgi:hypothetical protein